MAYREFHVEKIYEAPDVNILAEGLMKGAENTSIAIGNLFRGISEQQVAKRRAADQYNFDLGEGKFENDDKIFYQAGLNITERAKNDIRSTGKVSPEVDRDQKMWTMNKKSSDWQLKAVEQHEKEIQAKSTEDKYYDPDVDRNKLKLAAYGENNDVYYGTRGDRLEEFGKSKFTDPKSLRGKLFTYDWVGLYRQKTKEKSTGSPTAESTSIDKTPFMNEQGVPGVTLNHAKEYLNSRPDGSVARWVESLVHDDMDSDVRYMKQRDPELKNLNDDEVKLYLKSHPEKNQYNKKDFATRVIETAQNQLAEASEITNKIDYTTKVDKTLTGGLYNNDNIGHSYTEHKDVVGMEGTGVSDTVASAFGMNENKMPGGILRIGKGMKVGQAIPVELNPRFAYNIRTGANQENKGTTAFNLTGYQLASYRKDGKLQPIDMNRLESLPNSAFKDMEPNLGVALRGYTLDYGNKLGELASRQSQLDDEYNAAINSNDMDKQAIIQQQMNDLGTLKQKMNLSPSEFSDEDLMSAYKKTGVSTTSIKKDVLLRASQSDIDLVNRNLTQGLNLADKGKWNSDMLTADQRYQQRYQKAAAAGFADTSTATPKTQPKKNAEPPVISNDEDYRKLPKGAQYRAPDGSIRTKTK